MKKIKIPKSVVCVELCAFDKCRNLKKVHVEDDCRASLFIAGIPDPEKLDLPSETMVGNARLQDLRGQKDVVIPEGVEKIGDRWFWGSCIESVTIPASVKEIGVDAFFMCQSLKHVIFAPDSGLEKMGAGCFCGTRIKSAAIPKNVREI